MRKIKEMFRSEQSRYGTYSTLLIVIAIAIVVMVNLVAGQMPDKWKQIDLSSNHLYEITDVSRDLLKGLEQEIEIHVLADKSEADERIKTFLDKYAGLSSKISVDWTDPVLHPTILKEYNAEENTIVVECPDTGKQKQIAFTDIVTYDEMSYYYYGGYQESGFDAEGQLTGAVNYVVNDTSSKIYVTTGHGESALSDTISGLMDKSTFTVEELNTVMEGSIPEDSDLLLMYAPTKDISKEEKTMISTYLQQGRDAMLILGDTENEMPNLAALMKEYGLETVDGYIADTQRCYQGNAYYIFPELNVSGDMETGMETGMVMLINARGMKQVDAARDTISVTEFMTTSEDGYAVTQEKQTQGTYVLGAVAEETVDEKTGRFTVISSYTMIDSYLTDSLPTLENTTLFMNAVTGNFESVSNIAIEPKSLEVTYNTMKYTGVSSLIAVFGIPIAILIYGFVTWLKRRKV